MSDLIMPPATPLICAFDPDNDFLDLLKKFSVNRKDFHIKTFLYSRQHPVDFEEVVYTSFPDIFLLNLDQEDPLEFGKILNTIKSYPVPLHPMILGITSRDSSEQKAKAYRLGIDDYMLRPFSIADLSYRLEALLRTRHLQKQLDEATRNLVRLNDTLASSNVKLEELTVTDELTGLYNMRYMTRFLESQFQLLVRYGRTLSIVMMDLDHFKQVNDRFDHLVGSSTIRAAGKVIDSIFRKSDTKARYGGDEFIIALPETDTRGATLVCERLRAALEKTPMKGPDRTEFFVTASIGICEFNKDIHKRYQDIVKDADKSMYVAKAKGRNRVFVFDGSQAEGYDESQSTVISEITKIEKAKK